MLRNIKSIFFYNGYRDIKEDKMIYILIDIKNIRAELKEGKLKF